MNAKSIIKKVALALAGVAAITAVGFGIKAIVDYTKNDLKTISPSFEVGNLGADGKYVNDESTLYTKEAFACYGLQVKPDFDSTVNYQIFYYDILDNYISSTEVMSDGFSGEAPLNGAYARMVIEPMDDEDGKISWTEKFSYPKQLTVKVFKDYDVNSMFTCFKGQMMQVVSDVDSLVFTKGLYLTKYTLEWDNYNGYCTTALTILKVSGGSTLSYDFSNFTERTNAYARVFQFKDFPLENNFSKYLTGTDGSGAVELDKNTKYIIIVVDQSSPAHDWTDEEALKMPSCFSITNKK